MKRIFLIPPNATSYLHNGVFDINNGHNIFWKMDKRLLERDVEINTIDLDTKIDGDMYVYSDVPYPWQLALWKRTFATKNKNILFCFESPIVNPFSHVRVLHRFFKKVYIWDDRLIDDKKYFKFYIPQLSSGLYTKPIEFTKRKFLTLINSKKNVPFIFPMLSPYRKNLYVERIHAVEYFSRTIPSEFDLYGRGWDEPDRFSIKERLFGPSHYSVYKGEIKGDKIPILSRYKFCLCFENAEAPGYITEKIFDCFKARCVPIYYGAPDAVKYIPQACFIEATKFKSYSALLTYLEGIERKTFEEYIKRIELFLSDRYFRETWLEQKFEKILLENINDEKD